MRDRRILITGACGFTGRHLVARLKAERPAAIVGLDVYLHSQAGQAGWHSVRCDLTDPAAVRRAVVAARPDVVFHLAGRFRAASADQFRQANVEGLRHLCAALRQAAEATRRQIRMVAVGSAAEIGTAARLPVTEDAVCLPRSDYGGSKLEATRLALSEPADGPLAILVARPFNLIGPGQDEHSAPGSFARQVAAVARGEADAVHCGNLDTRRDFVDVRDAVEAYVALANQGRPGHIYNVCAGRSFRIRDLLQILIDATGGNVPVLADPSRIRPNDVLDIYGDHAKLTQETGWEPRIPLHQSLTELLDSVRVARRAA
jgi:GDP-4-dehydro-6-deoxy-D-mannose reductase